MPYLVEFFLASGGAGCRNDRLDYTKSLFCKSVLLRCLVRHSLSQNFYAAFMSGNLIYSGDIQVCFSGRVGLQDGTRDCLL